MNEQIPALEDDMAMQVDDGLAHDRREREREEGPRKPAISPPSSRPKMTSSGSMRSA